MTVKELREACDSVIASGFGDYNVAISNDEEGNGYHDLFYPFMTNRDLVRASISSTCTFFDVADIEHTVILG